MIRSLLILNGPNLNMLGTRQPEVYGGTTLAQIEDACAKFASSLGISVSFEQSNHEGTLVDIIQASKGVHDGIVFNAGADAIASVEIPTIELHLSNVHAREPCRHHSYLAPVSIGLICGFGANGYTLAMTAMLQHLEGGV